MQIQGSVYDHCFCFIVVYFDNKQLLLLLLLLFNVNKNSS